jgi:hypothetical protein
MRAALRWQKGSDRRLTSFGTLLLVLLTAGAARAQDPDTPPPGTIVLGPVRLAPSLVIKDMGVDNNVFNESVNPKSDFTVTVTPRAEVAFRARRLRTTYATSTDYVYYRKYSSERGSNVAAAARVELDLGRFRPYATAEGVNSRSRLNPEIDERARHRDVTYGAGIGVNVASRTHLLFSGVRSRMAFDPGEEFRGVELRRSFDGRRQTISGGIGLDVTPITRFTLLVSREQQRFELSPFRNSNTWRVTPGLTFSPTGVLTGSASVGYRHFQPLSPLLPAYSGLVSAVGVGATIYGRHLVQVQANRDVQYSYEDAAAYYVGSTLGLIWTYSVAGPFDVRATGARALMDYRDVTAAAGRDTVTSYGGGVGYRFSNRARLGVNVEWSRRLSDRAENRTYRNHRVFAGLTWGSTQ